MSRRDLQTMLHTECGSGSIVGEKDGDVGQRTKSLGVTRRRGKKRNSVTRSVTELHATRGEHVESSIQMEGITGGYTPSAQYSIRFSHVLPRWSWPPFVLVNCSTQGVACFSSQRYGFHM